MRETNEETANWWGYATDEEKQRYKKLGERIALKNKTIQEAARERAVIRDRSKYRRRKAANSCRDNET